MICILLSFFLYLFSSFLIIYLYFLFLKFPEMEIQKESPKHRTMKTFQSEVKLKWEEAKKLTTISFHGQACS